TRPKIWGQLLLVTLLKRENKGAPLALESIEETYSTTSPVVSLFWSLEVLLDRHALGGQLLLGAGVLGQPRQPHAAQHVGGLGDRDVAVADDLDPVAPGVAEIEERSGQQLDARRLQRPPRRLLVVDHEAEMPAIVGRLLASLLEGDELIAEIDERHGPA